MDRWFWLAATGFSMAVGCVSGMLTAAWLGPLWLVPWFGAVAAAGIATMALALTRGTRCRH